jgi:hypothetical protein
VSRAQPSPSPADVPAASTMAASARRQYRDLCSTCKHAAACGGRSTPERPIFFCEEFEVSGPAAPSPPERPAESSPAAPGDYKGLCMNCEDRGTCTIPKPEGGVWHCEEYR